MILPDLVFGRESEKDTLSGFAIDPILIDTHSLRISANSFLFFGLFFSEMNACIASPFISFL